jgi:hypothetical protein
MIGLAAELDRVRALLGWARSGTAPRWCSSAAGSAIPPE